MAIAAVLLLAAGYFFWLRDSSLVAVNDVKVSGLSPSPQRSEIEGALTRAGQGMTTLHVQSAYLEAAVSRFPTVAGVEADADFPHGLSIKVIERPPALIATDGESDVAVAANGEVLPGVDAPSDQLPTLQVDKLPSSGALTGEDLQEALVAGAAPAPLAPLVEGIAYGSEDGVTLTVKGGIELRFGDAGKAADKWAAAAAVLADPRLDTLSYVDVRVPKRPAVGGTGEGATSTPPETATTPTT